jgi:hypothetical protein
MQAAAAGTSTMQVVRNVVRQDGLIGLYRGATPGVVRSGILTATQCATYDQAKRWIMSNMGWQDGLGTQLVTGLATGARPSPTHADPTLPLRMPMSRAPWALVQPNVALEHVIQLASCQLVAANRHHARPLCLCLLCIQAQASPSL